MKQFMSIISLAAASAIALCAHPVLAANIERSCNAKYLVYVSTVNNELGKEVIHISRYYDIGRPFTARRGCGQLVPNLCRERASEAALQCMRAQAQYPSSVPAACESFGVRDYHLGDLLQVAKTDACKRLRDDASVHLENLPRGYTFNLMIMGEVWGDKGCGGSGDRKSTKIGLRKLRINCNE